MEEKDLEQLTATKLRELAKGYEGITGVHAMKKEDLIVAIHKARGEEAPSKGRGGIRKQGHLKKQIKLLREKKREAREKKDRKATTLLRKRIRKYVRLTRKLARAKA
ncbi:MAG: Rho termination factor N-terminal domain-containing protein [Deltaproteobacteria bacterium]|nr:Rho termination factor N-terminal domain-containing protein [Deltaproteobacteria bacterium]